MSATLRTAALVVGAVALVATGVGAGIALGAGTTLAAGTAQVGVALGLGAGAVGTLGAIGAGLSLAAGLTAKRVGASREGNPNDFTANPNQGLPYVMGRTAMSALVVGRSP
jgi:hypothetical protein